MFVLFFSGKIKGIVVTYRQVLLLSITKFKIIACSFESPSVDGGKL